MPTTWPYIKPILAPPNSLALEKWGGVGGQVFLSGIEVLAELRGCTK